VFHLWHVVHKPFSYTFAVLAMIHIGLVMMMGYM
jgi:type IV secretory pathway VirB2 component (pilin)